MIKLYINVCIPINMQKENKIKIEKLTPKDLVEMLKEIIKQSEIKNAKS